LLKLAGNCFCRVVKNGVEVFSFKLLVAAQCGAQVFTKWLQHGEYDFALLCIDGNTFYKVEYTIGRGVVLEVQPVEVQQGQQLLTGTGPFGQVAFFTTAGVLVQYI